MKVGEIYTEAPKVASKCKLCGQDEIHYHEGHGGKSNRKHKGKQYPTPFYFKAFYAGDWFRGNDEYLGRICKTCIKQGRLEEMLASPNLKERESDG